MNERDATDPVEAEIQRRLNARREEELIDFLSASLDRLDDIADRLEQIASGGAVSHAHRRGA